MDEIAPGPAMPAVPERAGEVLRATREHQGMTLAEVATRTRVPQRHLEAIEAGNYSGLPSLTYATGFAKAYARAIGADEVQIAQGVRAELAGVTRPQRAYQPYEATDPSRVPSKGVAMVALGLALVVAVLAGLYFATGLFRGGSAATTPEVVTAAPGSVAAMAPSPGSVSASVGQVFVTATDEVWVRIYDATGKTLHQGVLQAGQRFDVPADANDPMINVGRPDKISITLNGSQLNGLDLGDDPIKDVRVSAAALQARAAGQPSARTAPSTTGATLTAASPAAARTDAVPTRSASAPTRRPSAPSRATSAVGETQRANLEAAPVAAATTPSPGNTQ